MIVNERLLYWMKSIGVSNPFDRNNLSAINIDRKNTTRLRSAPI